MMELDKLGRLRCFLYTLILKQSNVSKKLFSKKVTSAKFCNNKDCNIMYGLHLDPI